MIFSQHSKILISLLRHHSFSEVAKDLGITQPAVSLAIKNLEKQLGVELVIRGKKRADLTPLGKKLALTSREFIQKSQSIIDENGLEEKEIQGEIKIGSVQGAGKSWVSTSLVQFSKKYPQLKTKLVLADSEDLLKQFDALELDCMILPDNTPTPNRGGTLDLGEERLVFIHSKKRALSFSEVKKEYQSLDWLGTQENDANVAFWLKKVLKKKTKFKVKMVTNSFGSILNGVAENIGVSILPYHVFKRSAQVKKIQMLKGCEPLSAGKMKFVFQKHLKSNYKITKFFEFLEKENQKK